MFCVHRCEPGPNSGITGSTYSRVIRPDRNPRQTSHRATAAQCGQVLLAARIRVDLVGPSQQPDPGPDGDPHRSPRPAT
jgi:hypothetical protein